MKVSNSEAIKIIKGLEAELEDLRRSEVLNSTYSYKEGETKILPDYNYKETRKKIEEINTRIRKIKHALALSNCTNHLSDFDDMTIGEGLVYLAQLNKEYSSLSTLSSRTKITRRITPNGVLEYTECNYDPEKVKKAQKELFELITALQINIDRANLESYIEI